MPKSKDKPESFEAQFRELEEIIAKLEAGDLPMEQSLTLFERGMELAKQCGTLLDAAELRIQELVPRGDQVQAVDIEGEES
jgi:exodeoxyribonuclease VII small subunit